MKRNLTLQIWGSSANGSLIAAEIIPLRKRRRTRSLAVKLGHPEIITGVEKGRYVVRLRLPNGGLVAKNVEVTEGGGEVSFHLDQAFSPNESAAWGYLLQPARRSLSATRLQTLSTSFKSPLKAFQKALSSLDGGLEFVVSKSPEKTMAASARESFEASLYVLNNEDLLRRRNHPMPWLKSSPFEYIVPAEQHGLHWRKLDRSLSASNDPNVVAEFTCHPGPKVMPVLAIVDPPREPAPALPLQSFTVLPPQTKRLLVIFDPARKQESPMNSPWNFMPDIADPEAMALYSYLSGRHFSQARIIANQYLSRAVQALEGKFENLSAAIVGGYCLIMMTPPWTRKRSKIAGVTAAELTQWIENLDLHFDHCADGAIINASQHLRCGRLGPARERFLAAIERGLPWSTLGARMLMDGLQLLAEDKDGHPDAEVRRAVRDIRPLYASIDWKSPFTTVRGRLGPAGIGGFLIEPAASIPQTAVPIESQQQY